MSLLAPHTQSIPSQPTDSKVVTRKPSIWKYSYSAHIQCSVINIIMAIDSEVLVILVLSCTEAASIVSPEHNMSTHFPAKPSEIHNSRVIQN